MTVKYTSKRPDESKDAIQDLEDDWTVPEVEPEPVVVVALVGRHSIAKNAGGDWQATAGLVNVAVLEDADDVATARKWLAEAQSKRSGETELEGVDGGDAA